MTMTTTNTTIAIPQDLLTQKSDLEAAVARIIEQQDKLTAQRKDIEAALVNITTVIDILSGKTPVPVPASTTRKPMSEESRRKLSEALKRAAATKKAQKMTTETAAAATDTTAKAPEPAKPSGLTPAPVAAPDNVSPSAAATNIHPNAGKIARTNSASVLTKAAVIAPKVDSHGKGASVPRRGTKGN
jgi:peptidoglycan hydrolase CwlO-like protein